MLRYNSGPKLQMKQSITKILPNRASSGRGYAAREPWRFSGKCASPARLLDGHAAPLTLSLALNFWGKENLALSKCEHLKVKCINPYEIIRKYKCEVCGEVMMCACDEEFALRFLPHQIQEGVDLETQQRIPVTLGFQKNICNTCRGLPEEPHPKAEMYGYTSKIRRYYWREIFFETTRRFADWAEAQGYTHYEVARRENPAVYSHFEEEVVEELRRLHQVSPKYHYQEEPQSVVIAKNEVEVVHLKADYVRRKGQRKAQVKCGGNTSCTVEEFVASYYQAEGYETLFTESVPFHALFGVFMWLLIQDPLDPLVRLVSFGERSSFEEKGQSSRLVSTFLPQDFGTPGYAKRRAPEIERHFGRILKNSEDLLWLFDYWVEPSADFRQYLWAHREQDVERARQIVSILPAEALQRILQYLVENYWGRYLGWPDLLVYREGEYHFVEVKSSHDKLGEAQKRWIYGNRRYLHLPFRIVKVHRR